MALFRGFRGWWFRVQHHPPPRTRQSLGLIGIRTIMGVDILLDRCSAILLNPLAHHRNQNISN